MGGGGLYGTAGDYIKFTQMILNKGRGNGNQVLKADTVATDGTKPYRRPQHDQDDFGDRRPPPTMSISIRTSSKKWGLRFLINTAKTPEGRSAGSLAWAGLANTYYWIDPARDVTGVILMQVLPFADEMPRSLRRLRTRRLCRAGRRHRRRRELLLIPLPASAGRGNERSKPAIRF